MGYSFYEVSQETTLQLGPYLGSCAVWADARESTLPSASCQPALRPGMHWQGRLGRQFLPHLALARSNPQAGSHSPSMQGQRANGGHAFCPVDGLDGQRALALCRAAEAVADIANSMPMSAHMPPHLLEQLANRALPLWPAQQRHPTSPIKSVPRHQRCGHSASQPSSQTRSLTTAPLELKEAPAPSCSTCNGCCTPSTKSSTQ